MSATSPPSPSAPSPSSVLIPPSKIFPPPSALRPDCSALRPPSCKPPRRSAAAAAIVRHVSERQIPGHANCVHFLPRFSHQFGQIVVRSHFPAPAPCVRVMASWGFRCALAHGTKWNPVVLKIQLSDLLPGIWFLEDYPYEICIDHREFANSIDRIIHGLILDSSGHNDTNDCNRRILPKLQRWLRGEQRTRRSGGVVMVAGWPIAHHVWPPPLRGSRWLRFHVVKFQNLVKIRRNLNALLIFCHDSVFTQIGFVRHTFPDVGDEAPIAPAQAVKYRRGDLRPGLDG